MRTSLLLAMLVPLPLLAAPREQSPPLFNGRDLTGWTSTDMDLWSVQDGAIVGSSEKNIPHNVFLWSPVEVGDFYLQVDVRITPDNRNAGIQFRSVVHPTNPKEALGYQADIGKGVWGCLYHESGRKILDWRGLAKEAVKPGEWNRYEILAVGDRLWAAINGTLAFAVREPAGERKGRIALQVHSGPPQTVRYKTLKLVHDPEVKLAGMDKAALHKAAVLLNKDRPSIKAEPEARKTSRIRPRSSTENVEPHTITDWPRRIAAHDPGSRDEAWAKSSFDDREWKTMTLPAHWENAGLPGYDGVVWFRRALAVPKELAGRAATLCLGAIDDMDVTWVNGKRVGGHEQAGDHFTPREYLLPAGTLKPGRNTIAVRVLDHGWGGGLAQTHGTMELRLGDQAIPLNGPWRYQPGANLAQLTGMSDVAPLPRETEPFRNGFTLRSGEVIAFAGGSTMVKQMEAGHLEALLTAHTDHQVFFRDIAWQADTVYQRQRPRNFGSQLELLQRIGATVIVANFGQTEVLDGVTRLPEFIAAYESLLDEFAARTTRIVVIPPRPFEKPPTVHLPDLTRHNGDVAAYTGAIRDLATRRGLFFVDLAVLPRHGLTDDGSQLTDTGQSTWASVVATQLSGEQMTPPDESLRGLIQRKNHLWRQHWRPTNWSFLYGNRQHVPSSHDHRPGQPRWFPQEVDAIIPLIEEAEAGIFAAREENR